MKKTIFVSLTANQLTELDALLADQKQFTANYKQFEEAGNELGLDLNKMLLRLEVEDDGSAITTFKSIGLGLDTKIPKAK